MDPKLTQVINITNNLDNFVPFGVLFVSNWPCLLSPGVCSSDNDGWKWVDFPYYEIENLTPLMKSLRLLIRKAYCRMTYKIYDEVSNIAIIRIYMLPGDSPHSLLFKYYRDKYFRFKKTVQWLERQCLVVLKNLLLFTDFNIESFHLQNMDDLIEYLKNHQVALIKSTSKTGGADNDNLEDISSATFNFHLRRLMKGESFHAFDKEKNILDQSTQTRLNNVYSNINSPVIRRSDLKDDDELQIHDMIMNDEIQGFKSQLYNFQKRSVLKMHQKETFQISKLMPNIIELDNKSRNGKKYYFDIKTLLPILHPSLFLPPRGGILAENMGLGKTCICLALICVSKFQISEIPVTYRNQHRSSNNISSLFDICIDFISQNSIPWKEYYDDFPSNITKKLESTVGYFEKKDIKVASRETRSALNNSNLSNNKKVFLSSTTLVVLPDNLFHQWKVEIFKHVEKNYLNIIEIQTLKQMDHLKSLNTNEIIKHDIFLISISVFSRQFENQDSILKSIYWKRLIIDEGHSMNSKTSRAVLLTKDLMYERMWVISGTPTSGLTNLHVENDTQEYTVQKRFDPKQDLSKLGLMVSNFFKIEPWNSNRKLWMETIVRPFETNEFDIELQLLKFLKHLLVRHNITDVENDIKLPALHHKPVFLKPSFFDKLSINLFISVLATNAVTSERKDVDFMFHPSNKSDLRRLVNNLQKGTFYWTGFSINDVENLLNICVYSLKENSKKYSISDQDLLKNSILIAKVALSNLRWRSVTTVHEMGYYVSGLPKQLVENYSLVGYNNYISVYGYPHLISMQKFYYKNRTIKTSDELTTKITRQSSEFWKNYWSNIKGNKQNGKVSGRPLSNKEEYKEFELSDVQMISKLPSWVETFNPQFEEALLYKDSYDGKRRVKANELKIGSCINGNYKTKHIGSIVRHANIKGTLSSKLNYLTLKLLENQMQGIKSIVFYEFENSAYYLTEFMDLLGMNYIMYSTYIKVSDRSNNLAQFDRWEPKNNGGEGITLIMDLKLASHGLTIIAATHIFFINPVWNPSVEAQAIKRSHRIGQMNEVFVETLILENTLEEEMYNMRNDVDGLKDVELIDHNKIKEYILQFPFLKMYCDGSFDEEYSGLDLPSDTIGDLPSNLQDEQLDFESDMMKLHCVSGKYDDKTCRRTWFLPLFTERNLNKLASSNNKSSKRRYDDISGLEEDANNENGNKLNVEKSNKYLLLEKLRSKRKRKVRFDI